MCTCASVRCTSQSFCTRRHSRFSFKQKNHTSYVHISLLLYSQSALKLLPRTCIYIYIYIYICIILLTCTGSHAFMFKCYVHTSYSCLRVLRAHLTPSVLADTLDSLSNKNSHFIICAYVRVLCICASVRCTSHSFCTRRAP
jgi:hypothetical protein